MSEKSGPETESESKGGSSQGIRDLIERTFLVGVGAAALTKDRVQDVMEEFVRRGQLSGEEGREMTERLFNRSRAEAHAAFKRADSSLQGAYREMGLVTKRELEDMDFRLRQVEHRVQLLETSVDSESAAGPSGEPG